MRCTASNRSAHLSAIVLVLAVLLSNVVQVTPSPRPPRQLKASMGRTATETDERRLDQHQRLGECPIDLHSSRYIELGASSHAGDGAIKFGRERSDYTIATQPSSDQMANRVDHLVRVPRGMLHMDHQTAPLQQLNETAVLETHAPDPPSYLDLERNGRGRTGVLIAHVLLASIAFIVLLPIAIFVRAGRSSLYVLVHTATGTLAIVSLCLGVAYRASTPRMYEKSSHAITGWGAIVATVGLASFDLLRLLGPCKRRVVKEFLYHPVSVGHFSIGPTSRCYESQRPTCRHAITPLSTEVDKSASREEYLSIDDEMPLELAGVPERSLTPDSTLVEATVRASTAADGKGAKSIPAFSCVRTVAEVLLLVFGYVSLLNGVITLVGFCRAEYVNGCMAHLIKGSIFFFYGLLTWARYVGLFARYGWAWNCLPATKTTCWTAEYVESLVCFAYGSVNVWLERLGKEGSPWTIKDIQHVSIALMFCFAGLLGMLLESHKIRSLLSTMTVTMSSNSEDRITQPPSTRFSFNPFPAIIVGTTGIAMSAHAQTYVFQVSIHALWGLLLALFSTFRFLTYFFLYIRPPVSPLPSRPPTEALASLCLTCGGVVFILSTEQVTFAAMRHGWDDVMAFLNVTVAFVSIVFCWILVLCTIRGACLRRRLKQERQELVEECALERRS
ncbi:BQ2448_4670 [Microbotryum intermedium]|uniref:BQ2448_4670 protein n=1 Tax=Microbotryum intermedium TaxID=269621 RepID=A0A238FLM2_9BASI|nr:BQ2448_4670 [Microbotryum intermedium]